MERKLATVVKIDSIDGIPKADSLEVASIKGWKSVIKKGAFKEGDLAIYFEVDSFLPNREEYAFLGSLKKMQLEDGSTILGHPLTTVKLRGQLSQGLLMPISLLNREVLEGEDVTEELGIRLYEKPLPDSIKSAASGYRTKLIPSTSLERVQNVDEGLLLDIVSTSSFQTTEKLDGTSATYYRSGDAFICASKNLEFLPTADTVWNNIAREYDLESKVENLIAISGEIIGPKIQNNPYKLDELQFYVYSVYDMNRAVYLDSVKYCEKHCLPHVPVLFTPDFSSKEELVEMANGMSTLSPVKREGIVLVHPELRVKAISNKYLLKRK